jgi:hypothetical protein
MPSEQYKIHQIHFFCCMLYFAISNLNFRETVNFLEPFLQAETQDKEMKALASEKTKLESTLVKIFCLM